jgi:type I restriction enzyme, S subunit
MNPAQLLAHFNRISEAPDAIPRLRRFILDLAVTGRLVQQDPKDEPAITLLGQKRGFNNAEGSSTLVPRGWTNVILGDLITLQKGKKPRDLNVDGRGLPYLDIAALERGEYQQFTEDRNCPCATTNDLIIVCDGSRSGLVLNGAIGVLGSTVAIIKFSAFEREYLRVLLSSLYKDLNSTKKGAAIPHLNIPRFLALPAALPPLAEQYRIVSKVDELMALCDRLEVEQTEQEKRRDQLAAASLNRLNNGTDAQSFREHARFHLNHLPRLSTRPEHIQQLRQTVLNLAVRGKLVQQDPKDEPASKLSERIQQEKQLLIKGGQIRRQDTLPPISAEEIPYPVLSTWKWVRLGSLSAEITSGSRGWAEFYSSTGPTFIRAQNIRFGCLELKSVAHVQLPASVEGKRTSVHKGDLLIVITGAGVTNPGILEEDIGEAYVSQHVGLVRPIDRATSRWFLISLMATAACRGELFEKAYGAGKPGLNLDNIRMLKVPLPPLAEQHRIVAKVDELMDLCDRLESQFTTAKIQSRRLLEAVLWAILDRASKRKL